MCTSRRVWVPATRTKARPEPWMGGRDREPARQAGDALPVEPASGRQVRERAALRLPPGHALPAAAAQASSGQWTALGRCGRRGHRARGQQRMRGDANTVPLSKRAS